MITIVSLAALCIKVQKCPSDHIRVRVFLDYALCIAAISISSVLTTLYETKRVRLVGSFSCTIIMPTWILIVTSLIVAYRTSHVCKSCHGLPVR